MDDQSEEEIIETVSKLLDELDERKSKLQGEIATLKTAKEKLNEVQTLHSERKKKYDAAVFAMEQ